MLLMLNLLLLGQTPCATVADCPLTTYCFDKQCIPDEQVSAALARIVEKMNKDALAKCEANYPDPRQRASICAGPLGQQRPALTADDIARFKQEQDQVRQQAQTMPHKANAGQACSASTDCPPETFCVPPQPLLAAGNLAAPRHVQSTCVPTPDVPSVLTESKRSDCVADVQVRGYSDRVAAAMLQRCQTAPADSNYVRGVEDMQNTERARFYKAELERRAAADAASVVAAARADPKMMSHAFSAWLCELTGHKKAKVQNIRKEQTYARKYSGVVNMSDMHDDQEHIQADDEEIAKVQGLFKTRKLKKLSCADQEIQKMALCLANYLEANSENIDPDPGCHQPTQQWLYGALFDP
jgi:hypothetical protein